MIRRLPPVATIALLAFVFSSEGCAQQPTLRHKGSDTWTFAVSGDSRNCGNVVMPAIAAGAKKDGAAFYWHLGDLRAIYKVDEDYAREERFKAFSPAPSLDDYLHTAWTDFTQHQVQPFGAMPFYIGIGNHETIPPMTRNQFLIDFAPLLDQPSLQRQRTQDAALYAALKQTPAPRAYFHWTERGVDFINLDNATNDAFDTTQTAWFDAVVDADIGNRAVTTIVVGMHEALPYSKSDTHSMCGTTSGRDSGIQVYAKLAEAQAKSKRVYLLASHSHYYLANIYDTGHWRDPANRSGVLPGWLVGTAGAERYPLPTEVVAGADAREHVYGYLLGTVTRGGAIRFTFHELGEAELQAARTADYAPDAVSFCVAQNPDPEKLHARRAPSPSCEAAAHR